MQMFEYFYNDMHILLNMKQNLKPILLMKCDICDLTWRFDVKKVGCYQSH